MQANTVTHQTAECCCVAPFCFRTFSCLFTFGKSCALCFNLPRDSLRVGGNLSLLIFHTLSNWQQSGLGEPVCKNAFIFLSVKLVRDKSLSQAGENKPKHERNIFPIWLSGFSLMNSIQYSVPPPPIAQINSIETYNLESITDISFKNILSLYFQNFAEVNLKSNHCSVLKLFRLTASLH